MLFNLQGIKVSKRFVEYSSNAYTGSSIYNYKFRTDNCTVSLWFQKRLNICAVLYFEMPRIVFGNKDTDTKPLDMLSYLKNVDSEHDDIGCIEKNLRVIEQFEVKWGVN